MAALQKIRSKAILLIVIIALGLFAFIAEPMVQSIRTMLGQNSMQVGKVYGQEINTQEFQQLLDSYQEMMKYSRGVTALSDEENAQAKDAAWQMFVNYQLVAHECEKVGLTVTEFLPHGLYPEYTKLAWDFVKHFSRDQETGEIIYNPCAE